MTKKTNQTLELVVETLVRAHPFERIVLFGSHATGHSQWDSDLDLLVIWQTDLPPLERALETRLDADSTHSHTSYTKQESNLNRARDMDHFYCRVLSGRVKMTKFG